VVEYVRNDSETAAREWGVDTPFFEVQRDFVLSPQGSGSAAQREPRA
jgi:hypothetical protein